MTQLKSITQITLLCSGNPQSHLEQERCVCFQWAVMNTLLWLIARPTTRKRNCYTQQHLLCWSTAMPRLPITEFQRLFASNRLHFANG